MRTVYGGLLVALGLLVLLRLSNGSGMLQLAGVLLILAGLAVALLRHSTDTPTAPDAAGPEAAGPDAVGPDAVGPEAAGADADTEPELPAAD